MNKPSKFALALAFAAFTATGVASAQTVDNWKNGDGTLQSLIQIRTYGDKENGSIVHVGRPTRSSRSVGRSLLL